MVLGCRVSTIFNIIFLWNLKKTSLAGPGRSYSCGTLKKQAWPAPAALWLAPVALEFRWNSIGTLRWNLILFHDVSGQTTVFNKTRILEFRWNSVGFFWECLGIAASHVVMSRLHFTQPDVLIVFPLGFSASTCMAATRVIPSRSSSVLCRADLCQLPSWQGEYIAIILSLLSPPPPSPSRPLSPLSPPIPPRLIPPPSPIPPIPHHSSSSLILCPGRPMGRLAGRFLQHGGGRLEAHFLDCGTRASADLTSDV